MNPIPDNEKVDTFLVCKITGTLLPSLTCTDYSTAMRAVRHLEAADYLLAVKPVRPQILPPGKELLYVSHRAAQFKATSRLPALAVTVDSGH